MKQIIIGKEGNQSFPITDPNVSRKHAVLQIDETSGRMYIIDNQSTNGTFIYNGSIFVRLFANQAYPVNFETMIQLGPETRFHISRLFQQKPSEKQIEKPQQPQVKKVDISILRTISDQYTQDKMKIDTETGNIATLGTMSIVISAISGVGSNFLMGIIGINDSELKSVVSVIITIIGFSIIWRIRSVKTRKLSALKTKTEHDYAVKYCCPACHTSFRGRIYENILAERTCPKCKAEFYEGDIKM
jgi:hypothetical protein